MKSPKSYILIMNILYGITVQNFYSTIELHIKNSIFFNNHFIYSLSRKNFEMYEMNGTFYADISKFNSYWNSSYETIEQFNKG